MPRPRVCHGLLALSLALGACSRAKPPRVAMMCDEGMVADSMGAPVRHSLFCRDSLGRVVPSPSDAGHDTTAHRGP